MEDVKKLNPLGNLDVNMRNALDYAIELRNRLERLNNKLSGPQPEPGCESYDRKTPNGMVEEMTETLCTINSILGDISSQINRLENTI